jgi:hypothetical protein
VADAADTVVCDIQTLVNSPTVDLLIPADVTAALCGVYRWDLQLVSPDGVVTTVLAGNANVTQEVTRV